MNKNESNMNIQQVTSLSRMKNKTIAIYGIGTYIFSVITSATDIEGNPVYPVAIVLISGFASFLFFIMAIIRLWKKAKNVSLIYASSTIIFFILSVAQEITLSAYGSPIIILCNIAMIIHFIAFIWVIIKLFKIEKACVTASHKKSSATLSYDKTTDTNSNNAGAYYNRLLDHGDVVNYDKTISEQTQVIEANPESPGIGRNYFLRGISYHNKGQYDQAIKDYSNAIKHDKRFLAWLAEPGHIYWGNEKRHHIQLHPETEKKFRLDAIKNTHQYQRYPFDYYYRACAHYAKGEYQSAILDFTKVIEIQPSTSLRQDSHYNLGCIYLKIGKTDSAQKHYEALKRLDENLANGLLSDIQNIVELSKTYELL